MEVRTKDPIIAALSVITNRGERKYSVKIGSQRFTCAKKAFDEIFEVVENDEHGVIAEAAPKQPQNCAVSERSDSTKSNSGSSKLYQNHGEAK